MEFRWNEWNTEHIERHGVSPRPAEHVVQHAVPPFPRHAGDGKFLVWGGDPAGLYLQVVFVTDEWDRVFVIHARRLTDQEKRTLRRGRGKRGER